MSFNGFMQDVPAIVHFPKRFGRAIEKRFKLFKEIALVVETRFKSYVNDFAVAETDLVGGKIQAQFVKVKVMFSFTLLFDLFWRPTVGGRTS